MRFRSLVLFLSVAVLAGCTKKESPSPEPASGGSQFVDPVKDVIACLDGPHHTLYVLPDERDTVLKLLHAEGSGDRYMMEAALNIHRKEVPIGFRVVNATLNDLLTVGAYFEVSRGQIPFFNDGANRDTARARLLDTLTKDGVFYRVYLDAQCTKISDGRYTECQTVISMGDLLDSTKPYKPSPPEYVRYRFYPISHCVKGKGSCVEALCVSMVTENYNNQNCGGAPTSTVESGYDFSCP